MTDFLKKREDNRRKMAESIPARKLELLQKLKDAGITHALVQYNGEGDSGSIDSVDGFSTTDVIQDFEDLLGHSPVDLPHALEQELENFVYDLIETEHPGYENNEGGSGYVLFNLPDGKIYYKHSDNVVETIDTDHSY